MWRCADDPYLILGLAHDAPDEEIRRRYRELVREYHPDRHIAAGVPEEMIEIATRAPAEDQRGL